MLSVHVRDSVVNEIGPGFCPCPDCDGLPCGGIEVDGDHIDIEGEDGDCDGMECDGIDDEGPLPYVGVELEVEGMLGDGE